MKNENICENIRTVAFSLMHRLIYVGAVNKSVRNYQPGLQEKKRMSKNEELPISGEKMTN